ncbi:M24 family metallopeptidase [Undibacterium sp. TJN19]|uniref:M24 family metallopeptidase n=1 Tax=Undibacterium sp. TJN19 TaxID=3413055 RepID=UPI003BF08E14
MKPRFEQRLALLRQTLKLAGQEALLIFSLDNLRYLSNYSGEAACGIVTDDQLFLITDYRFLEHAQEECVNCEVVCRDRDKQSLGQAIDKILKHQAIQHAMFEAGHINLHNWLSVAEDISSCRCVSSTGIIEDQRKIKDRWEIEQISQAAAIADHALSQTLPLLQAGVSERDIAIELDYRMQKLGSEGVSFPSIVGFGARSALPHCIPSTVRLCSGDLIVIDFGAVINGYRSDMTRSYVAGRASTQQRSMFDTVDRAQQAALSSLHAGLPAIAASAAANTVLQDSEFADFASNGLGHGLGIQLHEQPFISPHCKDILQANYIVTIEPGIYIPGYGGIRLEDDVLITEAAFTFLSHAPKMCELPF